MIPRLDIHFSLKDQYAFICRKRMTSPLDGEYFLNHSRSGLIVALMALDLPVGSSVGVMAFNCHTVMNAVAQVGLKIEFIDVTESLLIDRDDLIKKRNQISALIITHLFGLVNDVESIKADFPDLVVIEDCAHLFGKKVLGDFATYSIGQGKFPSVGDGGILIVNNMRYSAKVEEIYRSINDYKFFDDMRLFASLLFHAILYQPVIYSFFTHPFYRLFPSKAIFKKTDLKKMSKGINAMYTTAKKSLKKDTYCRLRFAQRVINYATGTKGFYGDNAFMVIFDSADPGCIQKLFHSKGVQTATHFKNCIDWAKEYGYLPTSCPMTEKLVNRLIMVPTYKEY